MVDLAWLVTYVEVTIWGDRGATGGFYAGDDRGVLMRVAMFIE